MKLPEIKESAYVPYQEVYEKNEHGNLFINLHDMDGRKIYVNDLVVGYRYRSDNPKVRQENRANWIPVIGVVKHSILYGASFGFLPKELRYLCQYHSERDCRWIMTSLEPSNDCMVRSEAENGYCAYSSSQHRRVNHMLVVGTMETGITLAREEIVRRMEEAVKYHGKMYPIKD